MSATLQRLLRIADECVPATNKESLIVELDESCLKWKEADDRLLEEIDPRPASWKELLPHRWGSQSELEGHRQYVDSLFTAFGHCLEGSNYSFPRTASLQKYQKSRKDVQVDLDALPELEAPLPLQKKHQTTADAIDQDGKTLQTIYTFQIINPRTNQIHQRIELSGEQTLLHLRQSLYCVHDEIKKLSTASLLTSDNIDAHPQYTNEAFSVRGSMYLYEGGSQVVPPVESAAVSIGTASQLTVSKPSIPSTISRPPKRTRLQDSAHRAKQLLEQRQSAETTALPSLATVSATVAARGSSLPTAATMSWEHVTVEQLSLAVGDFMTFSHYNGSCAHTIMLLDKRRASIAPTALPREVMRMKFRRRRCQVCDLANAQQLVVNDRLSACNPTFMCQMCYELLHYDHEGNLLYSDFSVFPYIHDT